MKPSMPKRRFEKVQNRPERKRVNHSAVFSNNKGPYYFDHIDGNHKDSSASLPSSIFLRDSKEVKNNSQDLPEKESTVAKDTLVKQTETKLSGDDKSQSASGSTFQTDKIVPILERDCNTFADLLQLGDLKIRFLLEKLLPADCINFLTGESDLGKSTWYSQLALSIVSGAEDFLGFKINTRHRRVLIVSTEDGPISIGNRLKLQMQKFNLSENDAERLIILTASVSIINRITEMLNSIEIDLIIIDAFTDIFEGDINTPNKVRSFLNDFSDLTKKYNCTFLFVHHIGKCREGKGIHKNQLLGSVGIEGKARQVLMMSRLGKKSPVRVLTIIKGNYVSEEDKKKSLLLSFDPDTRTFEKTDDNFIIPDEPKSRGRSVDIDLVREAHKLRKEGKKLEEIGRILNKNKATISRWLKTPPTGYDLTDVDLDDEVDDDED